MFTADKHLSFSEMIRKNRLMEYFEHGIEVMPNEEGRKDKEKTDPKDVDSFLKEMSEEKYGVEILPKEENRTQEKAVKNESEPLREKTKKDLFDASKNKVEILHNEPENENGE